MSRLLVTGVFGFAAYGAVEGAWHAVARADGLRASALAVYLVLKVGIALALAVLVLVRRPSVRSCREPLAYAACAAAVAAILLVGPSGGAPTPLVVAGDLVAIVAAAWLLGAVLALGRCFGILPEARGLVTRGPYRIVRHPVYLGELGAFAGLVLAAPTLRNLLLLPVFLLAQLVRMRLEEEELSRVFPEYRAYAARTPRLLPIGSSPLGRARVAT